MSKFLSMAKFPIIVLSGIIGQKIADKLWSQILGSEAPDTEQEHIRWAQLIPAAVVEGTLYKIARMMVDRSLRTAVARSTGKWPGGGR
jgi:hypothetical protein